MVDARREMWRVPIYLEGEIAYLARDSHGHRSRNQPRGRKGGGGDSVVGMVGGRGGNPGREDMDQRSPKENEISVGKRGGPQCAVDGMGRDDTDRLR